MYVFMHKLRKVKSVYICNVVHFSFYKTARFNIISSTGTTKRSLMDILLMKEMCYHVNAIFRNIAFLNDLIWELKKLILNRN